MGPFIAGGSLLQVSSARGLIAKQFADTRDDVKCPVASSSDDPQVQSNDRTANVEVEISSILSRKGQIVEHNMGQPSRPKDVRPSALKLLQAKLATEH